VIAINIPQLVQAILFALFADLTAVLAGIIGPTYDNLLVPEMSNNALFPSLFSPNAGPDNYLAPAAHFSTFLLANVVDPAITLVALGVAVLYFAKVWMNRWATQFDGLVPRLVLAVVAANFTVPIAGGILAVSGSLYPVVAGWDGGAWHQWVHLAGYGEFLYSWDNGALAFVLAVVEFTLVLGLVIIIGVRDALLAVLVVLLPLFTLLWPLRPLSSLARRAWFLFAELAFLPCVLVVPLELAVGSPNPVILVGYLTAALGAPYLLSVAGSHLAGFGFVSGGGVVQAGTQRGLGSVSSAAAGPFAPVAGAYRASGPIGSTAAGTSSVAARAAAPVAAPLVAAELIGQSGLHLVRHLRRNAGSVGPPRESPPMRGRGPG